MFLAFNFDLRIIANSMGIGKKSNIMDRNCIVTKQACFQ